MLLCDLNHTVWTAGTYGTCTVNLWWEALLSHVHEQSRVMETIAKKESYHIIIQIFIIGKYVRQEYLFPVKILQETWIYYW
jgi:hypothetical protein